MSNVRKPGLVASVGESRHVLRLRFNDEAVWFVRSASDLTPDDAWCLDVSRFLFLSPADDVAKTRRAFLFRSDSRDDSGDKCDGPDIGCCISLGDSGAFVIFGLPSGCLGRLKLAHAVMRDSFVPIEFWLRRV